MARRREPKAADPVTDYARGVVAGKIVAGALVRKACRRHLDDLKDGAKRGLRFDVAEANERIQLFRGLRHSKGEWAGSPIVLEPWEQFIVGSAFGWKRRDGLRRFRIAYCEIARKNGKSTLGAGVGIQHAFCDEEPGAEVYAAATKRDQAKIVWGEARRMVKASPGLRSRVDVYVSNLSSEGTAAKFEPLGADHDSMDGLNVHAAIVDELHAHKTRAVWDVLGTATGARRQPMIWAITTAGSGLHSVCREQREYGIKVLDGLFADDALFVFIATIDEGDDWKDPKVWGKANPNLGVSVKLDDLKRKCREAQKMPGKENSFKRLHLNVWTEQVTRWIALAAWDECAGAIDEKALEGELCYGGLDLSTTTDITAFVLALRSELDLVSLLCRFWIPEENVEERSDRDRVPYDVWIREGLLRTTPGNVIDYDFVRAEINALADRYRITRIGCDPWNATQIQTDLAGNGLEIVSVRQGFNSMSAPSKEFEKRILAKTIHHGGNQILRWMATNVSVKQDPAGNIKPDKSTSNGRIDGIVASIMALDLVTRDDGAQGPHVSVIGGD